MKYVFNALYEICIFLKKAQNDRIQYYKKLIYK